MATVFPVRRFLANGASTNMAVNGSVTPVVFTMPLNANEIFSVDELIFQAVGTGTISLPTEFWDFAGLTNGMTTELKLGATTQTLTGILKTNFDLIQTVGADFLGKILGTRNVVRGTIDFKTPVTFNAFRGDFYRITVRDNLTTGGKIENFTVCMRGTMVTKP
jgi:hypothetical protein